MTVIDGKAYAREVEAEIRALVQDIIAKTEKPRCLPLFLWVTTLQA